MNKEIILSGFSVQTVQGQIMDTYYFSVPYRLESLESHVDICINYLTVKKLHYLEFPFFTITPIYSYLK